MRQQRAELDLTEDKEVAVMGNEISGPHDEEDNDGDADDDYNDGHLSIWFIEISRPRDKDKNDGNLDHDDILYVFLWVWYKNRDLGCWQGRSLFQPRMNSAAAWNPAITALGYWLSFRKPVLLIEVNCANRLPTYHLYLGQDLRLWVSEQNDSIDGAPFCGHVLLLGQQTSAS